MQEQANERELNCATAAELDCIAGLGSYAGEGRQRTIDLKRRLQLLEGYQRAARRRQNWGKINASAVIDTVEKAIIQARYLLDMNLHTIANESETDTEENNV